MCRACAVVPLASAAHLSVSPPSEAPMADSDATPLMLRGAVRIGPSEPDSVVAMFPGVGAPARSLLGLASGWHAQLPRTQFILFEADAFSADRAFSAVCGLVPTLLDSRGGRTDPAASGYDPKMKDFDSARLRSDFFGDVLLSCCNDVSHALGHVLSEAGLADKNLVLAGFSQGASVAAYTGFMRGAAGTILMGGPGVTQKQLLPPPAKTPTEVCIVTGDSDGLAPHEQLADAFGPYGGNVHILTGVKHQITDDHVMLGGTFISSVLAKADGATS
eukprot:CAMPEP_0117590510 /NCGR_PEP_ID=MMETSP0784-20121206/71017_1 /TAXON_ID=39447 /ORGANISM="" /LENGTH=274 /DNA_ID=CAMNT_0005392129 /DNA_START=245 /DNA_END=1066 /DNA_ORIENTATION=+